MTDLWTWRETTNNATPATCAADAVNHVDLTGFDVEATDGNIGKIEEAMYEGGSSYLVVDTGFWTFGKKRMIPAGVADRVDRAEGKVCLSMSKDQVEQAPDYDPDRLFGDQRTDLDDYYGATAGRHRR